MTSSISTLGKVAIGAAVLVGGYAVLLGLLLTPSIQRFAVYAHRINTLFWHDIDDGTAFGFAKHQVTPFNIETSDGETLHAWHVLPLDVYTRNERALLEEDRPNPTSQDISDTLAFSFLQMQETRVVISFHGNAGHVAQGWRTDTYRYLTTQPNTHVLTIDYRGFGKSTGSPTEAGLIADAVALVDWVLDVAKVPPERMVLLGQSLGTAVASATALKYADPGHDLFLPASMAKGDEQSPLLSTVGKAARRDPIAFTGIVLVAPFSSLPSLLLTYRIGGFLPILLPVRPFPWLADFLTRQTVDRWPTAERLAAYASAVEDNALSVGYTGRAMGRLEVLHAVNDGDISYHQTEMICRRILGQEKGHGCVNGSQGAGVLKVAEKGRVWMRFEILEYGGHNRIQTYTPVAAAVLRAFENLGC